jgi:glycosyltransferase involved in cell wall biosynthesis
MKILQIVHGFPPYSNAGAEKYTYFLAQELAKRHDIHVLYPVIGDSQFVINSYLKNNIHFHELSILKKTENWVKKFFRIIHFENTFINHEADIIFKKFVENLKPDIIHFQHLLYMSCGFISVVEGLKIPMVFTLHDYWFMCPTTQLFRHTEEVCRVPEPYNCKKCWIEKQSQLLSAYFKHYHIPSCIAVNSIKLFLNIVNSNSQFNKRTRLMKKLLLKANKLIAPSQFLRNIFVDYGIPERRITFSENGYRYENFPVSKKNHNKKIIFGFIGRVVHQKGIHVLIEAFLRIPEEKAILQIYGGYDLKSFFVRQLLDKVSGKYNIEFMGQMNNIDKAYKEIDVLVFPSIWYENCPLVLAERQLTQTPVIASDIGAIPDFVKNEEDGLLFETNNSLDLYEKIMMIIRSPELIKKYSDNISDYPKTIERQSLEIEASYEYCLKKRDNRC